MDTLKKLWRDLYENKPLFYAVIVVVVIAAYLWWQNSQAQTNGGMMPIIPDGTMPEGHEIVPTGGGPLPPVPSPGIPPTGGGPLPPQPGPGGGGNHPPTQRTVIVTPWPTKHSTLWGIAQDFYGNGQQWPKIYNANKAKIGKNPNIIQPGWVLVVP